MERSRRRLPNDLPDGKEPRPSVDVELLTTAGKFGRRSSLPTSFGYSEAFCGEHLADAVENIPSSLLFVASFSRNSTKTITLGSAVANLPTVIRFSLLLMRRWWITF